MPLKKKADLLGHFGMSHIGELRGRVHWVPSVAPEVGGTVRPIFLALQGTDHIGATEPCMLGHPIAKQMQWRRSRPMSKSATKGYRVRNFILATSGAAILLLVLLWGIISHFNPGPPGKIIIATGGSEGAFQEMAERYKKDLARYGVELELRPKIEGTDTLKALFPQYKSLKSSEFSFVFSRFWPDANGQPPIAQ